MNVTLAGIEELDMFPDQQSREQAIVEHAQSVKGWDLVIGMAVCVAVGIGSLVLAKLMISGIGLVMLRFTPWSLPNAVREILTFGIVIPCMFFTIRALHRWGVRRDMRQKLVKLGVPVCVQCGYRLCGLLADAAKCPECGMEFDDLTRQAVAKTNAQRE
jgi:hypothetical protein